MVKLTFLLFIFGALASGKIFENVEIVTKNICKYFTSEDAFHLQ